MRASSLCRPSEPAWEATSSSCSCSTWSLRSPASCCSCCNSASPRFFASLSSIILDSCKHVPCQAGMLFARKYAAPVLWWQASAFGTRISQCLHGSARMTTCRLWYSQASKVHYTMYVYCTCMLVMNQLKAYKCNTGSAASLLRTLTVQCLVTGLVPGDALPVGNHHCSVV